MRTTKEYVDKLLSMRPNVYMGGQLVPRDDPRFQPGINTIAMTYDLVADQPGDELLTATSHLTGERINRFDHIHQNTDDLLKKQEMTRVYCQKTGRCIQRCMGIDALNAISVVAKEWTRNIRPSTIHVFWSTCVTSRKMTWWATAPRPMSKVTAVVALTNRWTPICICE